MPARLSEITRDAVEAALNEFDLIGREAFLEKYKFGAARDYRVQNPVSGTWADSKAVVGAAYGHQFPERGPLGARDFSGGRETVVRLLESIGFTVSTAEMDSSLEVPPSRGPWSRLELELVVADYLQMLSLELAGQKYNKAARRRALLPLLDERSESSIEFKRRNISAAMVGLGFPYLRGYVPALNTQALLVDEVASQIHRMPTLDNVAASAVEAPALDPDVEGFSSSKVPRPVGARAANQESPSFSRPVRRDYLEREARNRSLGDAGERFIVRYEQWRLAREGLTQLADKVRHVSALDGDGLGYDVLPFDQRGEERYLEVKTTSFGEQTPFFVSSHEVRFAEAKSERFSLCRVFDFRIEPKFFELPGALKQHCALDPSTYRATLL